MASDAGRTASSGGPQPTELADWLFGYAPRQRLLRALFGPKAVRVRVPREGFSAAGLAAIAGKGRDAIPPDLEALTDLGLLEVEQWGKRVRYRPRQTALANALARVLTALERELGG